VGIHALRLILAGVFDRLPTLQIIIGHMGEMIPFMLARINEMLSPMAKQLQHPVPEYFLHNFHITTSGFFTDPPLLLALQVMGADRIIFSVDYPFSANERGRASLDNVSIIPADKEKISHLNAEQLLRLEKA
jgi:predicted TIM-barrel fold metal-dependent hydrolase